MLKITSETDGTASETDRFEKYYMWLIGFYSYNPVGLFSKDREDQRRLRAKLERIGYVQVHEE